MSGYGKAARLSRAVMLLVLAAMAVGCGSDCIEGASVSCACPDGRMGAQVCRAGGSFGACVCAASDGGALDANDAASLDGATEGGASVDVVETGTADAVDASTDGMRDAGASDIDRVDVTPTDASVDVSSPDAAKDVVAPDVAAPDVPADVTADAGPDVGLAGAMVRGGFVSGAITTPGASVRGAFIWHGGTVMTGGGVTIVGGFR